MRSDAERNFYFFAKFILGFDWLKEDIHKPLCDILQDYEKNNRVKVTLPRSWLKSTVCSIAYPVWRAVRNPNIRVLLVQNTADNAKAKLRSIRGLFESNSWLRLLWAHVLPGINNRWTTSALELTRKTVSPEATFEAVGRATQVVGRHYNIIIEDDTVAPDKDEYTEDNVLPTKDDIGQAIGWHRAVTPLLVNMMSDMVIVVGTRWFEVDLLSWIGEKEKWYTSYERAVREKDGLPNPQGSITWPERFGEKALEQIEASMGPYLYSCLYLNCPLRSEDMVFQKKWFQYYETEPTKNFKTYTTVDPAGNPKNSVQKKAKNDYNTVLTTKKHMPSGRVYIVSYKRFKGSPGELIDAIFEEVVIFKPEVVGIEGIAYQESLEYFVSEEMRKRKIHFNIELLKHGNRSKEYRIRALQPLVKAGTLLFKGWMRELITELEVFPLGKNDDLADVLAMQLPMWDLTPVVEEEEQENQDETNFSLESQLRSLAKNHRPLVGTVMDVYNKPIDGAKEPDPYGYLWDLKSNIN